MVNVARQGNSHKNSIFQTLETIELELSLYEIFICELFQGVFPKISPSFGSTHRRWGRGQCVLKISCITTMIVIVTDHKDGAAMIDNRP